jgi:hypothetical protein
VGISGFRLQLFSGTRGRNNLDQVLTPFFKNFGACPHCQKKGESFLLEQPDEEEPVISRSDGESFHLVSGDTPISFPADKSSGKPAMMTAGFWYVSESRPGSPGTGGFTETVVVVLRNPPKSGTLLRHHLELLADTLAEKIRLEGQLSTFYEFDGSQLRRNP